MLNETADSWFNCSGTSSSTEITHENVIGVLIAVGANTIIPIALNLQKYAHRAANADLGADGKPRVPIMRRPIWWFGLWSMVGGEAFNLLAYGYSPTSLVAPVGAIGVLVNGLIATIFMKEAFGMRDALGLVCIAGGVVVVVTQVPDVQLMLTSDIIWHFVIRQARACVYLASIVVFVPLWWYFMVRRWRYRYEGGIRFGDCSPKHIGGLFSETHDSVDRISRSVKHPIVYLLLCASIASITVVSSRAFSSVLTNALATGGYYHLFRWVPFVALLLIIVTAVWSTAYLQKAMSIFPNNKVVPVYYVTFTLASVCAGAIVYREFDCMTGSQPPLFTAGCLTTFIGVFLTASRRRPHNENSDTQQCSSVQQQQGPRRQGPVSRIRSSESAARRHVELLEGEDGFTGFDSESCAPTCISNAANGGGGNSSSIGGDIRCRPEGSCCGDGNGEGSTSKIGSF